MIDETLKKIEARLQQSEAIKPESKAELVQLLATLKNEIASLSRTHADDAQSIAGFTELSTHEATRDEKQPHLFKLSVEGLAASVEGFEKSHPRLVQIVDRICTTLSNLGV